MSASSDSQLSTINSLHRLYCELTGFDLRLTMDRQRVWFDFTKAGFTGDDLRIVVRFLKRGIERRERNNGALRFSNLVGQLDYFEEDLAAARKAFRPAKPATRLTTQTVGDITRQVEVPNTTEPRPARSLVAETLRNIANDADPSSSGSGRTPTRQGDTK